MTCSQILGDYGRRTGVGSFLAHQVTAGFGAELPHSRAWHMADMAHAGKFMWGFAQGLQMRRSCTSSNWTNRWRCNLLPAVETMWLGWAAGDLAGGQNLGCVQSISGWNRLFLLQFAIALVPFGVFALHAGRPFWQCDCDMFHVPVVASAVFLTATHVCAILHLPVEELAKVAST